MNPGYFEHLDHAISALDLLIHHVEQAHCFTHLHDIEQRTRLVECMPHLEQLRLTLDGLNPENSPGAWPANEQVER